MWPTVFTNWERAVLPDLAQHFSFDADNDTLLESRRWRSVRALILALFDIPHSRLGRLFD